MWINVTAEDIAKGRREDIYTCPIALAATRAYQCPARWIYDSGTVRRLDRDVYIETKESAVANWVRAFDETGTAEPITFEVIEVTYPYLRT